MKIKGSLIVLSLLLMACSKQELSDAYGNFEADEVIVSAEANGNLTKFDVSEGDLLTVNASIGTIDTSMLHLQRLQLQAQKESVATNLTQVMGEVKVLEEQRSSLEVERKRLENLIKDEAAPEQQLDNVVGQINVINSRIKSAMIRNASVKAELDVLDTKLEQIELQIDKSRIRNPLKGTVLVTYISENEFVSVGKPLYKIADISKMILRVYVSGDQLGQIKLGDTVDVLVDADKTANTKMQGKVIWVADQAEFTPKIIQTKEERVDLVYAVKVEVENDGRLKIGMPGEVNF